MDFKLDPKVNAVHERESRLAILFVAFILVVGTPGIALTWGGLRGMIGAVIYAGLMGAIIYFLQADRAKTRQRIANHRLVLDKTKMILRQNGFGKEIDLRDIHGVRMEYKGENLEAIVVDITVNYGFRIGGYENMEAIRDYIKENVEPDRFKDRG